MKKKIKVICECHGETHFLTRTEVGRAFIQLRTTKNTKEHLSHAGKIGMKSRWSSSTKKDNT